MCLSCYLYDKSVKGLQVAQYGRTKRIALEKTVNKGWGVVAMEPIPAGSFLGVYSGELLLPCELDVREAYVLALLVTVSN